MSGIYCALASAFKSSGGGRNVKAITIAANTTNYTLNTAKVAGYVAGTTDVTLTINSGVYVYSTSTGTAALTVSAFAAGDTVKIVNSGLVVGMGGVGGNGGAASSQNGNTTIGKGGNGLAGGPALNTSAQAISLQNLGTIGGGGGGGGGSAGFSAGYEYGYGHSGGGGRVNAASGTVSGGPPGGTRGGTASLTAPGAGAPSTVIGGTVYTNIPASGAGGNLGAAGSAGGSIPTYGAGGTGGAAGAAVVGTSKVTYIATGTINGALTG